MNLALWLFMSSDLKMSMEQVKLRDSLCNRWPQCCWGRAGRTRIQAQLGWVVQLRTPTTPGATARSMSELHKVLSHPPSRDPNLQAASAWMSITVCLVGLFLDFTEINYMEVLFWVWLLSLKYLRLSHDIPVPSHCQGRFHRVPTALTPLPKPVEKYLSRFLVFSDYQQSCYEHVFISLSPDM